jgi:hypothetical protein
MKTTRGLAIILMVMLALLLFDSTPAWAGKGKKMAIGAAAGAAVGGVTKGKTGALLGATAGAAGGYAYDRIQQDRNRTSEDSKSRTAKVVGSSTLAGAAAGGMMGGKKGAAIGAAVGGVGGYVIDKKVKKTPPRNN